MPNVLGIKGFAARRANSGTPRVQAYPRDAADAATVIKKGHPLILNAGMVRRAAVAADFMSSATIIGFSNEWETSDLPRGFAIPPKITNEAALHEIGVLVATRDLIITINLASGIVVAQNLVDAVGDLAYDAVNDVFTLDTASHTTDTLQIVEIEPGQIGVDGGRVDCMVVAADSDWP